MIKRSVRDVVGVMLFGEANRKAPVRTEPHPPMVCVKLPKSVLVDFHLLEQRSCHISAGLKVNWISHFESSPLGAQMSGLVGQGSLLSAHV